MGNQQLAFYARGDLLVSHPTARRIVGQHPRYVGRALSIKGDAGTWPATEQPFVCEVDSDIARRLVKCCRKGALWPANEATARACGVPLASVALVDGEWTEAPPVPASEPKRSAPKTSKD